jgi:carboxyl-terminal processing protease
MPVSGGPSEKVGIRQGDKIISAQEISANGGNAGVASASVDSITVISGKNLSTEKIMKTLRGKRGSVVRLGVLPYGSRHIRYVNVKRDIISNYSVDAAFIIKNNTGYIKLSKFSETSAREVSAALAELKRKGMEKLIVDLRSNGGGLLDQCLEICDMFLVRNAPILYTSGLRRQKTEVRASGSGKYQKLPLVVLIDQFSASASEIFAGAMQDNDRAAIVGRRSFGKGLVQEQMHLKDGSLLRLTVAKYYTPSGRSIQKAYSGAKYEEDLFQRYLNGELFGTDSTRHTDTVKYYTAKGRVVYGGGGIQPDINIPYKSDSLYRYINLLSNSGILYDYSFNYVTQNRNTLNARYKNVEDFKKNFVLSETMLSQVLAQGKQKGIKPDSASLRRYGAELKILIKANIARDLFGDSGFYYIYTSIDEDIKKAMEIL